jgi:hypothetical protein
VFFCPAPTDVPDQTLKRELQSACKMLAEVCPSVVEVSCCTLAQNFILNVFLFDVQEEYQKLVAIDKKMFGDLFVRIPVSQ